MTNHLQSARTLRRQLAQGPVDASLVRAALADVPACEWDAWVDVLWDGAEVPDDGPHLPRGGVPYLPCPVATVLEALHHAEVADDDVFVDVGAGLGRVLALAHLVTGAGGIGVEIQPHLVAAARGRAAWLGLSRVSVLEGDAAELVPFVTVGTVFFMYSPFGGDRLARVLAQIEAHAAVRPLRLCCVHMPELELPWLTRSATPSPELAIYRSTRLTAPDRLRPTRSSPRGSRSAGR